MPDEEIHNTTVRTVLGSSRREHRWDLAHEVDITTVLGKSFFDLRLARPMGEDDVEISISCFLGSVELLVPVGTRVTLEGSTFLAGASSDVSGEEDAPPSQASGVDLVGQQLPRLDIAATAVLGRVRVRTPDRPERVQPQRFARFRRKKSKATPPPRRALADILADADAEERQLAEVMATVESVADPSIDTPTSEQLTTEPPLIATPAIQASSIQAPATAAPAPMHRTDPAVGGESAESATPSDAPIDAMITTTAPDSSGAPVDAEITPTPRTDGPVDMTFSRAEPQADLDDFDPADFPDDAPLAS